MTDDQSTKPNLVFILADQLRAASLPLYGETHIDTPNIDRLAAAGLTLENCISTNPVCTPYRAMMLTGRHTQTTGHIINSIRTRHTELSMADALNHAGYHTAWIGKWHLHTGAWPANNVPDWVPKGRDRLGFNFWRGYNMHMKYFNGFVNSPTRDYDSICWEGHETEALNRFAGEFLDEYATQPFAMFLSPHTPHWGFGEDGTGKKMATDAYYERLPAKISLPENVSVHLPDGEKEASGKLERDYRNYLAMILMLDDMIGRLLDDLERRDLLDDTLIVFTADHGNQGGAQGLPFWAKKNPYEESMKVPCVIRWPGQVPAAVRNNTLTAPVDFMPTLLSLCGVPVPRSVEGVDLSDAWRGKPGAPEQDALLCMNFGKEYDYLADGNEWRGVRTKTHQYTRWLDGRVELFNLLTDPGQMVNLAGTAEHAGLERELDARLEQLLNLRGDKLQPCHCYVDWLDFARRPIRNAYGPLSDPEGEPDWSLLVENTIRNNR